MQNKKLTARILAGVMVALMVFGVAATVLSFLFA